jgi:imidazolonepropionase-like amidohydrolase
MPGLIDAHLHAYCSDVSMQKIEAIGEPYRTAHAIRMLGHALDCGFTTVRDIGGGDYSLDRAIADGLVRAPRFFYAGEREELAVDRKRRRDREGRVALAGSRAASRQAHEPAVRVTDGSLTFL